jgi:hypothetical protein
MSKLYKVRLLAHAGPQRRRAGFYFEKGQAQTLELNKDQLEELQSDGYFQVKEAGEGDTADDSQTTPPVKPPTRKELDARATELGLNPKEYKNIEQVTTAIEEAEKAAEAGEGDDEEDEDLDLSTLSVDDLKVIATELNINTADLNAETEDQTKANLIEAIEAEKAKEE